MVSGMATARRTVQVTLDEDLVASARKQLGGTERPDDEVVRDALSAYTLDRLLASSQERANLTEEEAERLALEEVHAMRRERRDAT